MGLFKKSQEINSVFQLDSYTSNQKTWVLTSIAAFSFFVGIGFSFLYYSQSTDVRQKKNYITNLKSLNEAIEKNAILSAQGSSDGFDNLSQSIKNKEMVLNILKIGGQLENYGEKVGSSSGVTLDAINKYEQIWNKNKKISNTIASQKKEIIDLKNLIERAKISNPILLDSSQNLLSILKDDKQNKIAIEINNSVNKILYIDKILLSTNLNLNDVYSISRDLKNINIYINSLKNGSSIYEVSAINGAQGINELKKIEQAYTLYNSLIPILSNNINNLNKISIANASLNKNMIYLNQELKNIDIVLNKDLNKILFLQIAAIIGFISMAVSIAYLSNIFYNERNKALQYAKQLKKNQANESAVQTLLKQMNPLDIGNLTEEIKVKDKFVEPIAQRVDNTRKILQNLIRELKKLTSTLSITSKETNDISIGVLLKTAQQLELMDETITSIGKMTSQMDEIAQDTFFVKENAISSEQVSKDGLVTVNQAIEKMNQIRENIQESSKKIKRLGETSQSIVGVTDIIRHITKEINVLALNAAIQATNSGEGGKAFSIMAQEVQRLAESSTEASKQIDELIKNIQIDTQAAVAAMERTTQEVVEGTSLNDKAGQVLNKIATDSENLAKSIADVTSKIEEKSSQMVDISLKVRKLQETNNENTEKVQKSVEKIKQMHESSSTLSNYISKYQV